MDTDASTGHPRSNVVDLVVSPINLYGNQEYLLNIIILGLIPSKKEALVNHPHTPRLALIFVATSTLLVGCVLPGFPGKVLPTPTPVPTTAPPTVPPSPSPMPPLRSPVVIDTDMAADDWMAILYLLQRPELEVVAITVTGTGEAHCEAGMQHALGLVALAGYGDVPVACGLETPLQGDHAFPDIWREEVDNLLGLSLPESQQVPSELTAVELLTSTIQSSRDKVTLLTLGPLTNVGEALHSYPYLVNKLERIYIMGGAVNSPGNVGQSGVGIENNTAEWNLYIDPLAANLVLGSGVPITLVPLDATNHVPLTSKLFSRLESEHTTPEATFVYEVLGAHSDVFDKGSYYLWDPLAAAILTDDSVGIFQDKNLCVVETEGVESGWSKVGSDCPLVRVAVSADGYRFEQLFVDTLNNADDF